MPEDTAAWLRWLTPMGERRKLGDVALDVLLFAGMVRLDKNPQFFEDLTLTKMQMTAGLYLARNFLNPIISNLADPEKEKNEKARQQAKAHLERLNRRRRVELGDEASDSRRGQIEDLVLNEYENLVAMEMVAPEDIHVGFDGKMRIYNVLSSTEV